MNASVEKTSVALALDDLERDAVALVQHIHALRILADMPSVEARCSFYLVAAPAAQLTSKILDGFSMLLTAKGLRDDAPPK